MDECRRRAANFDLDDDLRADGEDEVGVMRSFETQGMSGRAGPTRTREILGKCFSKEG